MRWWTWPLIAIGMISVLVLVLVAVLSIRRSRAALSELARLIPTCLALISDVDATARTVLGPHSPSSSTGSAASQPPGFFDHHRTSMGPTGVAEPWFSLPGHRDPDPATTCRTLGAEVLARDCCTIW